MSVAIKECPFCGGSVEEKSFSVSSNRKGAKIEMSAICRQCGTTFGITTEFEPGENPCDAAIKKFNTRANGDLLEKLKNTKGACSRCACDEVLAAVREGAE